MISLKRTCWKKTRAEKLKEKLAKEEAEFEAQELARKKKQVELLKEQNADKKAELEQKKKEMEETKKNGGVPPKAIVKKVTFPGDYDKIILGKKALFLKECSRKLRPVNCVDVKSGSVMLHSEPPQALS
eukprot:TRINITY_DN1437_c0_g1_i1.p1 TRINITY_DN1437_c0_g1~~TRINITY_DN1437_c0_g1_i1.p1  ORF type:complete len:129 (+),score=47.29 TRINITY_DN1437_c0_g1_i1:132-518(+)